MLSPFMHFHDPFSSFLKNVKDHAVIRFGGNTTSNVFRPFQLNYVIEEKAARE